MSGAYREHGFVELLTPDGYNPKTKKGRARGYATAILHLAPGNLSGFEVCGGLWSEEKPAGRSEGCTLGCLNTAGHGGIIKVGETTNEVQLARVARTRLLFEQRDVFMALLVKAIETHVRRAVRKGLTPVVRLNGTSDLPWERMPLQWNGRRYPTVMAIFPGIQFYDYTKNPGRAIAYALGAMPANYHLTFSRSESNGRQVRDVLAAGGNVAAVFSAHLPAEFDGRAVVNGDADDLRFLDPAGGVWVGLKAKGRGRRDTSGFVVRDYVPAPVAAPVTVQVAA